jgi:hypothetical protein
MAKSKGSATPRRLSTSSLQAGTKKWRCRAYVTDWSGVVIGKRTYVVTANNELGAVAVGEAKLLSESFDAAYRYLGTCDASLTAEVEPVTPKRHAQLAQSSVGPCAGSVQATALREMRGSCNRHRRCSIALRGGVCRRWRAGD